MNKKRQVGVFIGRFQPFHDGHRHAIQHILDKGSINQLIILVGSVNQCLSIKNPWTFQQRKAMIEAQFGDYPITILPLNDYRYNDSLWISDVKYTLYKHLSLTPDQITLFGYNKPDNHYLKWFNDIAYQSIPPYMDGDHTLNATDIRHALMLKNDPSIPATVLDDFQFYQHEAEQFKQYPYPDTLSFICADVIVECLGHILLIRRKFSAGKNTWALAGGFKQSDENLLDCAIRELYEETDIDIPEKVIRGSIVNTRLFDAPDRSFGIPRITQVCHIKVLPDHKGKLPKVRGQDDASDAQWFLLHDVLNTLSLYDDHKDIIMTMTHTNPLPAVLVKD